MIFEWLHNRKNIFLTFIVVSVLFISYLHYSTIPEIHDLHNIFAELYYIPLMIGALVFGMRGAVITFMCVSVLYIPHIIINWTGTFSFAANKVLHALTSGVFAFLAGLLIDREKKIREQAEKDRYLAGLGQASAAIVHDLKNPLISISGFARRISQGKGDPVTASEVILKSTEDMDRIVHDVLDFSKPLNMDFKDTDVSNFINEVSEYCQMKADQKEVRLSVHMFDGDGPVSVDRSHMKRALINLVNNAIEASDITGVVEIMVEMSGDILMIRIKDNGDGMDVETLENIFIPFYTKKNSGTGLGMAIAKKIIEGHEGKISVESQLSEGTVITVCLPVKRESFNQ